jgi:hypothetical protein
VAARVDSVHVSFVAGRLSLDGFRLANPEGFGDGDLVALDALRVNVPRNLFAPSIRIPELAIEGLELDIEQKGGRTNVGALLDGMQGGSAAEPAASDGRELVIERLLVRDTTARLHVAGRKPIALRIPELAIENVGGRGTREQNVAEVVRRVLTAVLRAVARNPELPRQIAGELAGGVRALDRAGGLEELGRRVGEEAGGAEGLGDLLRRKR